MVGRMSGGLHFLVEIELEMAKMPAFTNLKAVHIVYNTKFVIITHQDEEIFLT